MCLVVIGFCFDFVQMAFDKTMLNEIITFRLGFASAQWWYTYTRNRKLILNMNWLGWVWRVHTVYTIPSINKVGCRSKVDRTFGAKLVEIWPFWFLHPTESYFRITYAHLAQVAAHHPKSIHPYIFEMLTLRRSYFVKLWLFEFALWN
jgi:hypothetical protein